MLFVVVVARVASVSRSNVFMLPRKFRLTRSECATVFRRGRSIERPYLKMKVLPTPRVGVAVVVPKSIFKRAVDRHAIKRKISEALRSTVNTISSLQAIITAKRGVEGLTHEKLRGEVEGLFRK